MTFLFIRKHTESSFYVTICYTFLSVCIIKDRFFCQSFEANYL